MSNPEESDEQKPLISGAVNPHADAHPSHGVISGVAFIIESLIRQLEAALGAESQEITADLRDAMNKLKSKIKP